MRPIEMLIQALETGKYKAVQGYLRTKAGFCSLGVAMDMYDPLKWQRSGSNEEVGEYYAYGVDHGIAQIELVDLYEYFGLVDSEVTHMIEANDGAPPEKAHQYAASYLRRSVLSRLLAEEQAEKAKQPEPELVAV